MAAQYTCLSCQVIFANAQLQRSHYKCDWHRYNLKRKVAALPPVTAEEFQQRVLAQKSASDAEGVRNSSHCEACGKQFASRNAFDNHVKSKKHQEAILKHPGRDMVQSKNAKNKAQSAHLHEQVVASDEDSDDDWESMDEDDDSDKVPPTCCLFCEHCSDTAENNALHMTSAHSFFIPDAEYLIDLEGLLTYLGYKVGVGKVCLWCGGRTYRTVRGVRQHMIDLGHCKMSHDGPDGLLEYADFYDYTSSYPDDEDVDVEVPVLDGDGWQLVLPSGATVGHRSLFRYYRQNLPAASDSARRVLTHYRALGWTGATSREEAVQKARDVKFMRAVQAKQSMRLGVKANKLQKHFRQQVLF